MDRNNLLSLLGLALRGGNLAVGEEPVEAESRAHHARVLLLASDASDHARRRIERFADAGNCMWLRIPFTKDELGRAVGRSSVALLAVTDIGLANAVVQKLSALDGPRYGESAAQMALKAKRAAERKTELIKHEKNLRAGKQKKKPAAPDTPAPEAEAPKPAEQKAPARPRAGRFAPGRPGAGRPFSGRPASGKEPRKPADGKFASGRASGKWVKKDPPGKEAGRTDSDQHPFTGPAGKDAGKPAAGRPAAGKSGGRPGRGKPAGTAASSARDAHRPGSRRFQENRPKPKAAVNRYAHSHPVKKGKGSFRSKDQPG